MSFNVAFLGAFSYGIGSVAFALLTLLLLTSWRGRLQGTLLVVASAITAVWAATAAWQAAQGFTRSMWVPVLEVVRYGAWYAFLWRLLYPRARAVGGTLARGWMSVLALLCGFALFTAFMPHFFQEFFFQRAGRNIAIVSHLLLAIAGLALIEQLYRNARPERRWGIKFLCWGIGGLFVYDFFLFADAWLFARIDPELWDARGLVFALAVPLIAVSAARNPEWSLDVFLSRRLVLHTAALLGTGIYLLIMAAGGYYIRLYGGSWGAAAQAIFLFGAAVVLLVVVSSGQARASAKVFFNKHFFNRKYDYREEWLRFTKTLSDAEPGPETRVRAIQAIAEIVDSPGGMLLWRVNDGPFQPVAHWNFSPPAALVEPLTGNFPIFLERTLWIINLQDLPTTVPKDAQLDLPEWLRQLPRAWLVIPLVLHRQLHGMMILAEPRAPRPINWEDRDLLKAAGSQATSYIAQLEAVQALLEVRQLEAFGRLSAFVIHDLKNLIAQLSLVVKNAARHKHNPEFMEDAIRTVEHAAGKMNKLLSQLRAARPRPDYIAALCDLNEILRAAVAEVATARPLPQFIAAPETAQMVRGDKERLTAIFVHLLQNAQEATPPEGEIILRLQADGKHARIEVEDNGHGMPPDFIRDRLFRPFQSTKGGSGMGIGTYQCRAVVREMGGEITVQSAVGKGTLFRIILPLAVTPDQVTM